MRRGHEGAFRGQCHVMRRGSLRRGDPLPPEAATSTHWEPGLVSQDEAPAWEAGRWELSAVGDGRVHVWDRTTGEEKCPQGGEQGQLPALMGR